MVNPMNFFVKKFINMYQFMYKIKENIINNKNNENWYNYMCNGGFIYINNVIIKKIKASST